MQNDTSCETVKGKFRLKCFRLEIFWLCVSFFFRKKICLWRKQKVKRNKKAREVCGVWMWIACGADFSDFSIFAFFFYLFIFFLFATFGCAIAGRIWVQSSVEVCKWINNNNNNIYSNSKEKNVWQKE